MRAGRTAMGGFSPESDQRLGAVVALFVMVLAGWAAGGWIGVAVAAVAAVAVLVVPWWGLPAWTWARLRLRGRATVDYSEPMTVATNRVGGGVRIDDRVAVVAVQVLGKAHRPTKVTGSVLVDTDNVLDLAALAPMLHQALDLQLDSLSAVSIGSRHGATGDFPRVYDTEIGTPPYAGRRDTWLILRLSMLDNPEALRWRTSLGAAAIAAAAKISNRLRCAGLRARVGTASDLTQLDRRLGGSGLVAHSQRWKALRVDGGWLSTYSYPGDKINAATLAQAWTLPADEVTQNVTLYPDGSCTATVTVRTAQPAPTPPSVILRRLDGQQAAALAATMCMPRPVLWGVKPTPLPEQLPIEIGPSGVLIGRLPNGDRLLMPLTDPKVSRVFIAAEDSIAKRIVIRLAGSGQRVTVHTSDVMRWNSVRMPAITVVDEAQPAPNTTVSVMEAGGVAPSPRPATVVTVAAPGTAAPVGGVEVVIEQVLDRTVTVSAGGQSWTVEVDLFRAENRYVSLQQTTRPRRRVREPMM